MIAATNVTTGNSATNTHRLEPNPAATKASINPIAQMSSQPLKGRLDNGEKCRNTLSIHSTTQSPNEHARLGAPIKFEISFGPSMGEVVNHFLDVSCRSAVT